MPWLSLHRVSRLRGAALLLVVMACADSDAASPSRTGVRATSAHEISAGLTGIGRIAFVSTRTGNDNTQIYTMNPDGRGVIQLSNSLSSDVDPAWSPGRQKIAFASTGAGSSFQRIYTMNADGSGVTQLTNSGGPDKSPAWSPDGSKIAFTHVEIHHTGTGYVFFSTDICLMNADGSAVTRLTRDPHDDSGPTWSPDGSRIVFDSDRSGRAEI